MGNIKVLIATANFGGIDEIHTPVQQFGQFDVVFVCYDEIVTKIDGFTNRMAYKFAKTNLHKKGNCDLYIWIDGRVEIGSPEFVEYIWDMCSEFDMGVVVHPERATLADEYDYILSNLGKEYLAVRYKNEDWATEIEAYKDRLDAKLYNARLFVIVRKSNNTNVLKSNNVVNEFMTRWWEEIQKYTIFDQSQFTYLLDMYKNRMKIKELYWEDLNEFTITHKHIKNI